METSEHRREDASRSRQDSSCKHKRLCVMFTSLYILFVVRAPLFSRANAAQESSTTCESAINVAAELSYIACDENLCAEFAFGMSCANDEENTDYAARGNQNQLVLP